MDPDRHQFVIPYKPRPHQAMLHAIARRFNIWILHRRAGKTVAAICWLLECVLRCELPRPQAAFISPFYRQSRAVAWHYMKHYAQAIPGARFKDGEMLVALPDGAQLWCLGGDNPDALRGLYLDAVVCDEMAQIRPRLWTEVIRPALSDREGSFLGLGTPAGRMNLLYELFEFAGSEIAREGTASSWSRALLTVHETMRVCNEVGEAPPISKKELGEMKRLLSAPVFAQELLCDFTSPQLGAYYAKESEQFKARGQITRIRYDAARPVSTAWDLGLNDRTIVGFFQTAGNEIHVFDCWSFKNTGLLDVCRQVLAQPYRYAEHIAPADIRQRNLTDNRTRWEIADELGLTFEMAPGKDIAAGIDDVRAMLPRMFFDEIACADLIEAIRYYHAVTDEKRNTTQDRPEHDWSSDYCDMLRYYCVWNSSGVIRGFDDYVERNAGGYTRQSELRRRQLNRGVI